MRPSHNNKHTGQLLFHLIQNLQWRNYSKMLPNSQRDDAFSLNDSPLSYLFLFPQNVLTCSNPWLKIQKPILMCSDWFWMEIQDYNELLGGFWCTVHICSRYRPCVVLCPGTCDITSKVNKRKSQRSTHPHPRLLAQPPTGPSGLWHLIRPTQCTCSLVRFHCVCVCVCVCVCEY